MVTVQELVKGYLKATKKDEKGKKKEEKTVEKPIR